MDIHQFLLVNGPVIDVRSPKEFQQGHLPGAVSLPLFTDSERALVGTAYKRQGHADAVRLGLKLVGPKLSSLIEQADALAGNGKSFRIYCWRGGMRSSSMAWLLSTAGYHCTVLSGGYKSFRKWVTGQFEKPYSLVVLGGLTGCGKTEKLHELKSMGEQTIDLEGLANHRGSSFGHIGCLPQPSCEQFTNTLAWELSRLDPARPVWVEDESRMIGTCQLPHPFWKKMCEARMAWIEASTEARVGRLVRDYGMHAKEMLLQAVRRLEKKLGGAKTKYVCECIEDGRLEEAIVQVLEYYDKTYAFSCLKHPREKIAFIHPIP